MPEFFHIEQKDHIAEIAFNRPDKANALNDGAWREMKAHFERFSDDPAVRVIILRGEGKHWCAGIDLELLMGLAQLNQIQCEGRKREQVRAFIHHLQNCITAIENCRKPVLSAIHGGCIGGGVDIATACDLRYCSEDAYFSVKEVDLGLVADIGTLQRLPKLIPPAVALEMAFTGRKVGSAEAKQIGLVNGTYPNREELYKQVRSVAETIAAKSPLVIRGIKEIHQYTRDHSVPESLNYVATYNAAFLLSDDLMQAFQAKLSGQKPVFKTD
jgi:enoyl-CoA hydratase